ncbi:MAG: MmgE/PrpD family protein [Rhodospirillales bacterium CG15_BIG_FIL_POST_REV_8_21_14_020_66_15]|nr:MAG: MmgE/PrpD family protein [Rhodospirillales bacterium CG15_BIG_FIL_POST_REV_8_21_14_020_66_15]
MNKISAAQQRALLTRLAERITRYDPDVISEKGLWLAKLGITDTVGVTLAGLPEDCTQIALRTPGVATAPGASLVFGSGLRTSALDAAFVNGIASHALDYDDFSSVFGGHQSVPLVAPLFALAEDRSLSGRDLIAAYAVGLEAEMRLARAVHPHHYDKGWHPTATLGIFGTAAGAARLLGLSVEQTALALAISASLASGLKANFGTMTKPLHIGHSARSGVLAVLLAEQGFDANPGVLEHHQGFFEVFNGAGTYAAERLLEGWDGGPWEIEAETLAIKQFPCCGSTHQCITAMQRLARKHDIPAEAVAGIEIMPHRRRLRHTNTPMPDSELEAKFSVQYVVARTLLDGTVKLKDFEGDAFREDAVRRLLSVTTARPHPDLEGDTADQWGAEIVVTLKDGRKVSETVSNLIGRSGDDAMTAADLWEKFEDCAGRALPAGRLRPLFDGLMVLEQADRVPDLVRLMDTGA